MTFPTCCLMLAYTPFWDPIQTPIRNFADYSLWMLLPLVVAISIVYKGTKVERMNELPVAAAKLTGQILAVMALLAVGLYLLYWVFVHGLNTAP